jgi:hypothetical protein
MKYEDLPNRVMNVYGYPTGLIEKPVVMEAVRELVNERKKLLADKRELMRELMILKERQRTSSNPPGADASTSPSSPSGPRDGLDALSPLEPGTNGL